MDMAVTGKLTVKQKAFVEAYVGNASEAARIAGYSPKTAHRTGQENMQKPSVLQAIKERGKGPQEKRIASRQARQQFWTEIMNNENGEMKDRLKASELLGRSEADFVEKRINEGTMSISYNRVSPDGKVG